jgi:hypothetical protein
MPTPPNHAAGGNAGERRSSARSNRGLWAALPGMPQLIRRHYALAMHTSLQPKTNIKLLVVWSVVALGVTFVASPTPWLLLSLGAVLGACAGAIQLRAIRKESASFLAAQSMTEVRRALSSSRSGRLYLYALSASSVVLLVLAFFLPRDRALVGLLAGYSAFAFTRELLRLRATFELHRLSTEQRV